LRVAVDAESKELGALTVKYKQELCKPASKTRAMRTTTGPVVQRICNNSV